MGQPILCPSLLTDSIWLFPKLTVRNVQTKASHSFTHSLFPPFAHPGLSKQGIVWYHMSVNAPLSNAAVVGFTHLACYFSEGSEIDWSHLNNDFYTTSSNMAINNTRMETSFLMYNHAFLSGFRHNTTKFWQELSEFGWVSYILLIEYLAGKINTENVCMCYLKAECC